MHPTDLRAVKRHREKMTVEALAGPPQTDNDFCWVETRNTHL